MSVGVGAFALVFIPKQGKLLQSFVKVYNFTILDLLFCRCFLSFDSAINEVSENSLFFPIFLCVSLLDPVELLSC